MTTYVIINNNYPVIGTHVGLVIVNNGFTTIYDPGGSYMENSGRGSDGTIRESGVTLQGYLDYQGYDGGDVYIYSYSTTSAQEAEILNNIDNIGDPGPLFCAYAASSALSHVGPFADLEPSVTPSGLNSDLQDIGGYNSGNSYIWISIDELASRRMAILNKLASDLHIDLRPSDCQYGLTNDSLRDASFAEKEQYCEVPWGQMEELAGDIDYFISENVSYLNSIQIDALNSLSYTCYNDSGYLMMATVGAVDPLVLDLDGDGIETASSGEHSSEFVFADASGKVVGWVSPDDGFLVLDHNLNGIVDDDSELFGNAIQGGFHELAQYDSNNDGVITAEDGVFANLKIWRDINSNGRTDTGELLGLSEYGIMGFSLTVDFRTAISDENIIFGFSEYWTEDGTRYQTGDAYLRLENDQESSQNKGASDAAYIANEPRSAGEIYENGTVFLSGIDVGNFLNGSAGVRTLVGGLGCDTHGFSRGDGADAVGSIGHSANGDRALFGAEVENLVAAVAAFSPVSPGQTTLSADWCQQFDATIAASWKAA